MTKLYSARVCPFAHRARLALREKGVPYEIVEIDLRNMPDWYKELSPNQKVPLLEVDGRKVWESSIIAEFVDEHYPGPALMPTDPVLRAHVRIWIDKAGSGFIPAFYKAIMKRETEPVLTALDELERHDWGGGPYWLGPQCTLADLNIYPWLERWAAVEQYGGLRWDEARFPNLTRWGAAMRARDSVQAEANPPAYYVEQYVDYANR